MSAPLALICCVLSTMVLTTAADDGPWAHDRIALDSVPANPGPAIAMQLAASGSAGFTGQLGAPSDCSRQNVLASLRPEGPLPPPGQMPSGSTMARIVSRGYLIVGILEDADPFAFRDVSLQLQGFDIDLARDIGEAIFGDREHVVFRPTPEVNRFEPLRSDQVDLVVAAATITCKRREQVDFSTVYYEAGQRVLVNHGSGITGLDDLAGRPVCAARGSTSLARILAAPSKPIAVGTATETDCLMMLQLGEVDAVSTDDTLLAGMAAQDPQTEVVGPRLTDEPYGIATSKDTPDLVRFINAVLQRRVQDGRWEASYQHWLSQLGPPPALPAPQYRD